MLIYDKFVSKWFQRFGHKSLMLSNLQLQPNANRYEKDIDNTISGVRSGMEAHVAGVARNAMQDIYMKVNCELFDPERSPKHIISQPLNMHAHRLLLWQLSPSLN